MIDQHPGSLPNAAEYAVVPTFVRLSDIVPQEVEWLWENRIAVGKVTLLAGDPGLGKSFTTLDIASRVSAGAAWSDHPGVNREPAGVILLSAEDGLEDTVRPRLDAMGADCTRIGTVTSVLVRRGGGRHDYERGVDLSTDIAALENAMDQVVVCKLVVIDPISVYMGDSNANDNHDVRAVLSQLSRLAERRGVAVVVVSHLKKGEGPPISRVIGSIGFVAAARTAWVITKDPENAERRLMLPLKNNIAPDVGGLAYSIPREGEQRGTVCWEPEPVMLDASEVFEAKPQRRGPAPEAREEAKVWLETRLEGGAVPAAEITSAATEAGISLATLRRAREDLGVVSTRSGQANWWSLPSDAAWDWPLEQPEQLDENDDDGW